MTRTMYDSVNADEIPVNAAMVLGYNCGTYENLPEMRRLFPHAIVVACSVDPHIDGEVLDCEKGDATPAQCPAWAQRQRAHGGIPTVYCSMAAWPSVRAAFAAAKVAEPLYGIADWDNQAGPIPAGAIYKQFGGVANRYDLNTVADYWPGIDPAPAPPTAPALPGDEPVANLIVLDSRTTPNPQWCVAADLSCKTHLDHPSLNALLAVKVNGQPLYVYAAITGGQLDAIPTVGAAA